MNTQKTTVTAQHTPGPWIRDSKHGGPQVSTEAQAAMLCENIGTDREWEAVGIRDDDGFAEVVALVHPSNASLIAAAPEMLAALQQCHAFLTDPKIAEWLNRSGYGVINYGQAVVDATAAITRATHTN
jgi:hypothetical protein